jgi:hypothetical protein
MSPRESALQGLLALLEALPLPSGAVKRNSAVPERVVDQVLVILRDGELGEPEVSLSPVTYHWQHEASVDIFVANAQADERDARMDALLVSLGEQLTNHPALGGAVDFCAAGIPKFEDLPLEGAPGIKTCVLPLVLHYSSASALG